MDKKKILNLVKSHFINEALIELMKNNLPKDIRTEAILLNSRLSNYQKEKRQGVINNEEKEIKINTIVVSLLELVELYFSSQNGDAYLTTEKEKFINEVSFTYEKLGFKVTQIVNKNNDIKGDILVSKAIDGFGNLDIAVFCMYIGSSELQKSDLINFFEVNSSLLSSNLKAIIVTNADISNEAKEYNSRIEIIKLSELLESFYKLDKEYEVIIEEYEREKIFREFIPIRGFQKRPIQNNIESIDSWLVTEIIYYLNLGSSRFFSIFADYGSGKTTILRKVFYTLSKMYVNKESKLKPLFLELKEYYKHNELNKFVESEFRKNFNRSVPYSIISSEIENGGFVLLLDGFDEMSMQTDKATRFKNFNILSPLLLSNSTTVFTCRPSYFVEESEYNDLVKEVELASYTELIDTGSVKSTKRRKLTKKLNDTYESLHKLYVTKSKLDLYENFINKEIRIALSELSQQQINLFLQKFNREFRERCGLNWRQIRKILYNIYDLTDLMKRPILLSMIKDTVLLLGKNFDPETVELGPTSLYEFYVNLSLDLEWSKGETRRFMNKEQRIIFSESIALSMFKEQTLSVSFDKILNIIKQTSDMHKKFKNYDLENIDYVAADVQICTFITRREDGLFKFIHKSFMEFFVAKILMNQIKVNDIQNRYFDTTISNEILTFLGGFALSDDLFAMSLKKHYKKKIKNIRNQNLLFAYLYSRQIHNNFQLSNSRIEGLSLKKTQFYKGILINLSFYNTVLFNCKFLKSSFQDVSFLNSELEGIHFEDSIVDLKLTDSPGKEIIIFNNSVTKSARIWGEKSPLEKCKMTNCRIEFAGKIYLSNIEMLSCEIENSIFVCNMSNFNDCVFKSILTKKNIGINNFFVGCQFNELIITEEFITYNQFTNCKGILYLLQEETEINLDSNAQAIIHNTINYTRDKSGFDYCKFSENLVLVKSNSINKLMKVDKKGNTQGYYLQRLLNEKIIDEIDYDAKTAANTH